MQVILGDFIFSMGTAYYNEIRKSASQRIASQSGYLVKPTHHDLGPNSRQMSIPCQIFPCSDNAESVDVLINMMQAGEAYQMIGLINEFEGELQGKWRIESINETHRHLKTANQAEVIEFDLSLLESQ